MGGAFQAEAGMPRAKALRWEVAPENRGWGEGQSGWKAEHRRYVGPCRMQVTRQPDCGQTIIDFARQYALSPQNNVNPLFSAPGIF